VPETVIVKQNVMVSRVLKAKFWMILMAIDFEIEKVG